MYSETLAYNQGKKSTLPHTTAPHTSWRIAGPITAKPMSWLPDIVTYVTPHLRMGMYLYYCFINKHYHIYRANCLAVVGVITGVRIERHKLQSLNS
jgi:hypothetical protein